MEKQQRIKDKQKEPERLSFLDELDTFILGKVELTIIDRGMLTFPKIRIIL